MSLWQLYVDGMESMPPWLSVIMLMLAVWLFVQSLQACVDAIRNLVRAIMDDEDDL